MTIEVPSPVASPWTCFAAKDLCVQDSPCKVQAIEPESCSALSHSLFHCCFMMFFEGPNVLCSKVCHQRPGKKANGAERFTGTKVFRSWGCTRPRPIVFETNCSWRSGHLRLFWCHGSRNQVRGVCSRDWGWTLSQATLEFGPRTFCWEKQSGFGKHGETLRTLQETCQRWPHPWTVS